MTNSLRVLLQPFNHSSIDYILKIPTVVLLAIYHREQHFNELGGLTSSRSQL